MTDQLQTSITQTLENASPDVLEVIFDAAVFEEHLALTLEGFEDATLEAEVHRVLLACGATAQEEGTFVFDCLENLRCVMNKVATLLEEDDGDEEYADTSDLEQPATTASSLNEASHTGEEDFIVFDDAPWQSPEAFTDTDQESLELESKGYQLRKIPFSKIRVVPANNPRKRTARAGIVRLARNISKRGLQQPVTVRPDPEEAESFQLAFGYRRHAAIGYAIAQGWLLEDDDVICIVRKLTDSQMRLAALSENEEREEVDVLDQAEGWAKLRLRQTENAIANAAGIPLASVKRCLKVAFGVCEEAKVLYREGKLDWNALIAFTYGSLLEQRTYLKESAGTGWKLAAQYIKQSMTLADFKLVNARFTLEELRGGGRIAGDRPLAIAGWNTPALERCD